MAKNNKVYCSRLMLYNSISSYLRFLTQVVSLILQITTIFRIACIHMGWLGGAMVLGKLPVPGRPSNLGDSRARAYCA